MIEGTFRSFYKNYNLFDQPSMCEHSFIMALKLKQFTSSKQIKYKKIQYKRIKNLLK